MRADACRTLNEMMKLGAFFHPMGNQVAAWPWRHDPAAGSRRLEGRTDSASGVTKQFA
jgi:hypothetical protein